MALIEMNLNDLPMKDVIKDALEKRDEEDVSLYTDYFKLL